MDLKAKPFYLDDTALAWVHSTLAGLTCEEKVGQLFCEILWDRPGASPESLFNGLQPGAVMYRPFSARQMLETTRLLQNTAKVPLLIACNLERGGSGGNGGLSDGTYVASPMGVAATGDPQEAYNLGLVAAREGAAVGINWTFEPIVDLDLNPENPITNVRTYGSDPDQVIAMASGYMNACRETGVATCIKHFPGDGVDHRDQHLLASVNSLTANEWFDSYGRVYQALVDHGAPTLMSAHIKQPALARLVNPQIADGDILPGSLSRELNEGILRGRMGFNGLIVTDATQMVGFTATLPRRQAVPLAIANGADMFLFTINQREDMDYMLAGVREGVISARRLDEAVTRILALKASLGLHTKPAMPGDKGLEVVGCEEHRAIARRVADRSVTLVKDTQGLLPLPPGQGRRAKIVQVTNERLPEGSRLPEAELFKTLLEAEGYAVSWFDEHPYPGETLSLAEYRSNTDLVVYFANMKVGSNQTTIRLSWDDFLGESSPKFVQDIPTLFLSFSNPYHLVDVPMVRTYVNAYTCNDDTVHATVEKLMGRSRFTGTSPVDPFAGLWDARL